MDEAQIAALKKTNPAELLQKALSASMELQETLTSIDTRIGGVESKLAEGMKAIYKALAELKELQKQTAECMEKHKAVHVKEGPLDNAAAVK